MTMHTSSELNVVLDKLANDDTFRERMLGDPVGALGDLGITLHPDQVPAVRSLPSKDTIAADQSAVHDTMASTDSMIIFLLSGGA
jgi:putative modified peptide